jgi:hypothetical protein
MIKVYESRYKMFLTVIGFLRRNALITGKLPGFSGCFDEFCQNTDKIKATKELLEHGGAGTSSHVALLRNDLIAQTLAVACKVEAYATLGSKLLLAKEVHYPATELKRARGTSLCDKALLVYNRAMEHAAELEKFGVAAEMLTGLKEAIDNFCAVLPAVRMSIAEAKVNNDRLNELFKANCAILRKIDLLLKIIEGTNADIYSGYTNTRKAVRARSIPMSLMIKVVSAESGEPICGAKVTITPKKAAQAVDDGKPVKAIVRRTSDKGMSYVKQGGDDSVDILLESPGYAAKLLTAATSSSQTVRLVIRMERS